MLSTETALFSAEDALAQAQLAHLQALVGLFNALGGGWSARKSITLRGIRSDNSDATEPYAGS